MNSQWECLAYNQVWMKDNFLTDEMLELVLTSWNESAKYQEVAQGGMKYLVTPTDYHYNNVSNKINNYSTIQREILDTLNPFYLKKFGKTAPDENLSYIQYFLKTAVPNVSFYDLHCEPSTDETEHFGDAVFMLYLSDETDGELVFPTEADAQSKITPAYEETCKLINVKYVNETVSITPKKNRCVVLRTGVPHYVNVCSGMRYCISGMSFADADYKNRWKEHSHD